MIHGVSILRMAPLGACVALLSAVSYAAERGRTAMPDRRITFYGINEDPVWNFGASDPEGDALRCFSAMLKQTGCGALRMPVRWRVVEPSKGEWDFSKVDRVVQAVPSDVEILGTIMSIPQWANGMNPETAEGWFDSYPPKDRRDWEHAVFTIVDHYKARVKHWEIWNEENGVEFYRPRPDPAAYTRLLKSAYASAKRADPDCIVVLGGLQMNGIVPNPWSEVKIADFLEHLYEAGAQPYFDVCNIHPYVLPDEGAERMMSLTQDTLSLMARYGDGAKPLWITEVGCGAASAEAEEKQARLLSDTFATVRREPRVERVYWFLLRDMAKDLLGPEGSMGLFSHDGRPKPALDAVVGVTQEARARSAR